MTKRVSWLNKRLEFLYVEIGDWQNITISVVALLLLLGVLLPLLQWGFWRAVWSGDVAQCHSNGACWIYIEKNARHLLYGLYPKEASWRMDFLALLVSCQLLLIWQVKTNQVRILFALILAWVMPVLTYYLCYGGILGLQVVPPQYWGGLLMNFIFSAYSIATAFFIGGLLALIRQKNWGIYSALVKIFIDLMRGLPLVSLLFFATLVLPYFFFDYHGSSKIVRLYWVFTLFGSAYMSEAIRGGLQSVSQGQREAAQVLGLSEYQSMISVVIPQALQIALPSIMNLVVALFKDSTLLSTIAVLDVVGMMQATSSRVEWMPYTVEGYLFVGFVFWLSCYGLSAVSASVEKKIKVYR